MPGRSALVGRYAEASLSGVLIALLFDWKVTFAGKTVDLTVHLDTWEYIVPLPSGWTFTAKGYVVPASVLHYPHALWSGTVLPVYFTVAGFSGSVNSGTKIFEGAGLPVKGEIGCGMEMAVQDWEIKGHGAPTVGVS